MPQSLSKVIIHILAPKIAKHGWIATFDRACTPNRAGIASAARSSGTAGQRGLNGRTDHIAERHEAKRKIMRQQPSSLLSRLTVAVTALAMLGAAVGMFVF